MKTLQNNFTTVEQSKRLLELGVPADSADCYYNTAAEKPYVLNDLYSETIFLEPQPPCWSVGRLIEILEYLIGKPFKDSETIGKSTLLDRVLSYFESANKLGKLDFSKLEE